MFDGRLIDQFPGRQAKPHEIHTKNKIGESYKGKRVKKRENVSIDTSM